MTEMSCGHEDGLSEVTSEGMGLGEVWDVQEDEKQMRLPDPLLMTRAHAASCVLDTLKTHLLLFHCSLNTAVGGVIVLAASSKEATAYSLDSAQTM